MSVMLTTADVCDQFGAEVKVAEPVLRSLGGRQRASGEILVVNLDEDNRRIWALVEQPGDGRILVINNAARYCAVVGDQIAALAVNNHWGGFVVNGYVRDTGIIRDMDLALWALGTCPQKCPGKGDVPVQDFCSFAGLHFFSGEYVYIDHDGLLLSSSKLAIDF